MAKQGLALVKKELAPILENLARAKSRHGEFDWHELVPDVATKLRHLISDDSEVGLDATYELARIVTADFFRDRVPKIPEDQSQLALFYDPDAYLTLGEGQRIRMADAQAPHVERWRTVETSNFQSQSSAYFFKMRYIDERLPELRDRECSLSEIDGQ